VFKIVVDMLTIFKAYFEVIKEDEIIKQNLNLALRKIMRIEE
jgi:hypothetical protein